MRARTARTMMASLAIAGLLMATPGFVGIASAHDGRDGESGWGREISSSPELQNAVKAARDTYFLAARKAKADYRASIMAIRTAMQNEAAPQLAAAQKAKQALDAAIAAGADQATIDALKATLRSSVEGLRTVIGNSKTAHAAEFAAALKVAKAALDTAAKAYAQAVTTAFATYAPGTPVPAGLLIAPGHSFGWSFGPSHLEGLNLDSGKDRD